MANRYVTTTGSDAADGSIGTPWLTIQWAVDHVSPGDVINVAPGTYAPSSGTKVVQITVDGTSGSPITLRGSGGLPVFSGASLPVPSNDMYLFDHRADWWIFEDFDVTGSQQLSASYLGIGILIFNAANNIFRRVSSYGHEGPGWVAGYGGTVSNTTFTNCDAYDNYEPGSGGGNSDGFAITANVTGTIFDGCRAWHNSDDGFDVYECESAVIFRNCWAWAHGYDAGNGSGFKLGRNDSGPLHQVHQCLAFNNINAGFHTNSAAGPIQFYNNTAYNNTIGEFTIDASIAHVMRNNAAKGATNPPAATDDTFNSWNLGLTVNAADFASISQALASAARADNGDLPINDLFRLVPGSDLINVGTNVGLSFNGAAPDLGAFESGVALVYRALRRV